MNYLLEINSSVSIYIFFFVCLFVLLLPLLLSKVTHIPHTLAHS